MLMVSFNRGFKLFFKMIGCKWTFSYEENEEVGCGALDKKPTVEMAYGIYGWLLLFCFALLGSYTCS